LSEFEAFDAFFAEGYVTELIRPIRSGKEASVFLCRANPSVAGGASLLAMKVYRDRERRGFQNDHRYKAGRVIENGHDRRAVRSKSRHGRAFDEGWWIGHEWETLVALHEAGADVPRPVWQEGDAILMEYLGDEEAPAPQLRQVSLEAREAREVFDRLLWNVEVLLRANVIHADLSPFNVLWWEERAVIIDLPQAVDPRTNPNAAEFLARDVANLCRHFERFGVRSDPDRIARGLWMGFMFADL
jgi:RIO kinase 1